MNHVAISQLYRLRPRHAVPITTRRQRSTVKKVAHRLKLSVAMTLGTALQHMQEDGCIYLDYNATTPIYPEVRRKVCLSKRSLWCFCLISCSCASGFPSYGALSEVSFRVRWLYQRSPCASRCTHCFLLTSATPPVDTLMEEE